MESKLLFTETQKFKQLWIWLLLVGVNGIFLYAIYQQIIQGKPMGNNPMSDTGLLIGSIVTLAMTLLFMNFRLDTQIKEDGIYVRFFPFNITYKKYSWDTISKAYIRQYNPIKEYGGWGIRFSFFGKGKALNISGDIGLQLEFKNGKKLLIGTLKGDEIKGILPKLMKSV